MLTDADIAAVLGKLALNYHRPIDDDDTVIGMLEIWRTGIGGCAREDVETAMANILADPEVRFFPTVADFRRRVIDANVIRTSRAAAANPDPWDTFACLGCLDSGWMDAGTDGDGYWFVQGCPNGCKPPLFKHRVRRNTIRGRRRAPSTAPQQMALSEETMEAAVAGTARMVGDRVEQF